MHWFRKPEMVGAIPIRGSILAGWLDEQGSGLQNRIRSVQV